MQLISNIRETKTKVCTYLWWNVHWFRIRTCLENPWISEVQFQGLESTWNWFLVLESPWFFIEQDWKVLMLTSFKVNEGHWKQWSDTQSIKLSKCLQNVLKPSFFVPTALLWLMHVHSATSAERCLHTFSSSRSFCMCTCFC